MNLVFIIKLLNKMNLDCLNNIITDNLAIHIDISNIKSWNLNTGYTTISLNKWNNAISDDLLLYDFGLTAYDNGRVNKMYNNITLTKNDNKLILYRIGSNNATGGTFYNNYQISGITGSSVGNYLFLNGGYLQGYFKLFDYNFELLPPRYNNGITIETIIEILPQSNGIFYLMGVRSEDKYNDYFSGETNIVNQTTINGNIHYDFSGITTSENNYLNAYEEIQTQLNSFSEPENSKFVASEQYSQINNVNDNIIAFEITNERKIKYKYVSNGNIIENTSPNQINRIGWTIIDIVFKPYDIIENYDSKFYKCYKRRKGDLKFYINGRLFWNVKNFDEFYFKEIANEKEKQLGVPFNVSWGGGSFGLENSWHYDFNQYSLYSGNNLTYINTNFTVQNENNSIINDLSLSATSIFNFTTMEIKYVSGITANTGVSYYVIYNSPISILSNREYQIELDLFDFDFFRNNENIVNNASIFIRSNETNIEIIDNVYYNYPNDNSNSWVKLKTKFKISDNVGEKHIEIGLKINTNQNFNINNTLYISNFNYTGADILNKDKRKNNLLIQKYFNSSFIGNIQKLRIYNKALENQEILHNSLFESKNNTSYGILVSKGGRIISQYQNVPYIPQQSSGSDIRKSIRYRNSDGSFKDLYQMIDIKVIIKSRSNPNVELVKFKKVVDAGWLQLIFVNDTTYDFIVPDTITSAHPNEILFAEIKFQWADPDDIDNVFDKIFITNITTSKLLDNSIKNY